MRRIALLAPAALMLAACVPEPAPPPGVACDASAATFAVGQVADPTLVEQARTASGASIVRTIEPGQIVTMEYRADRLNLELDAADVVIDVTCG